VISYVISTRRPGDLEGPKNAVRGAPSAYGMVSISRYALMKRLLRILGCLLTVGIAIIAVPMVYSTAKGYATWYFRVNGLVTVDGHKTTGYLHANLKRTVLLLTRTDGKRAETYLVYLPGMTMVDCGDWNPPRFFPSMVSDVNPPCSPIANPATNLDPPLSGSAITRQRSIELSTASGKHVKAEW
jgi:hypothetical protein